MGMGMEKERRMRHRWDGMGSDGDGKKRGHGDGVGNGREMVWDRARDGNEDRSGDERKMGMRMEWTWGRRWDGMGKEMGPGTGEAVPGQHTGQIWFSQHCPCRHSESAGWRLLSPSCSHRNGHRGVPPSLQGLTQHNQVGIPTQIQWHSVALENSHCQKLPRPPQLCR